MSQKFLDESTKPSQYFFDKKIQKYPLNLLFFSRGGAPPPRPPVYEGRVGAKHPGKFF